MRKRLVLWTILIALALGGIPWIHGAMDEKKDDVVIYEEVLSGNPAAASGLAVKTLTHMDQYLFWETTFRPGGESDAETMFTFEQGRRPYMFGAESQLRVTFASGNYGYGGSFSMEEMINETITAERTSFASHAEGQIWKPVVEVAKRAPVGEEYTEVVKLKDYYEFYPMAMDVYVDDSGMEHPIWVQEFNTEDERILSEFFAVAIPEDIELQIIIVKDEQGNVIEIDSSYTEDTVRNHQYLYGDNFSAGKAVTEDGGYFILSRMKNDPDSSYEVVLDSPRLEDDYGIYYVPFAEYVESGVIIEGYNPERKPDVSQLCNVFPMDDGVNALELYYDEEGGQLILLTEETGHLWATVIDQKTMKEVQKLDLGEFSDTEYIGDVIVRDDLFVVGIQDQFDETAVVQPKRMVLMVKENGQWELKIRSSMNWEGQEEDYPWFNMNELTRLAWDGERLAIAQWERYRSSCDVYVLIFEEDEMPYVGVYRRRDTSGGIYDYNRTIQSWSEENGLEAWWEKE